MEMEKRLVKTRFSEERYQRYRGRESKYRVGVKGRRPLGLLNERTGLTDGLGTTLVLWQAIALASEYSREVSCADGHRECRR